MESLDASELPTGALLLIDSAPIIYILEAYGRFAARFAALFARHANHEIVFAVSAITIEEVLTGPLKASEEALAGRYRSVLESWRARRGQRANSAYFVEFVVAHADSDPHSRHPPRSR